MWSTKLQPFCKEVVFYGVHWDKINWFKILKRRLQKWGSLRLIWGSCNRVSSWSKEGIASSQLCVAILGCYFTIAELLSLNHLVVTFKCSTSYETILWVLCVYEKLLAGCLCYESVLLQTLSQGDLFPINILAFLGPWTVAYPISENTM